MINKLALVTGSNQGIGFAIVEELLKRGVKNVYVTARNEHRGRDAVDKLKAKGLNPQFHPLEVTNTNSVRRCAEYIKMKHGGLDILINNAGVITESWENTTYDDAVRVINTNYHAILTVQEHFFPILNRNARVINISSDCGHISNLKNKDWIARLTKKDVQKSDIDAFIEWFLNSVKTETWKPEDFFQTQLLAYKISKIALCALTVVQQREIDRNISINSLHPGFVQTSMTTGSGVFTLEEASKAPVYLALDVDQSVKGQYFWYDKEPKDWRNPNLPLYCDYEVLKKYL
ncbi:carbonyl reductase [NADPH] 3-like [Cydia pomonella]|uniref:carbonyl reductase [NADPH] 3-like n=1 Tax=Cydia pomonella TaxID=82600 RepID=UPI002ADDA8D6|nr:carbonyl reductase [NADPH] 3-like [Cydia pomonella]XP_061728492.1 carbonyl reductase [NADPH] 3-like [Cydia pomonella]